MKEVKYDLVLKVHDKLEEEDLKKYLEIYANRQKVFDSILLNKLEGFFSDLGWSLNLNPHLNTLKSFEI